MSHRLAKFVSVFVFYSLTVNAALYDTTRDKMRSLAAQYPQFASTFSIGQNDDGVEVEAIRISTTPQVMDPAKIGNLMVATHHGNERHSATFALYFMEQLLKRYASSEVYRTDLADKEWTIIPVLNISGYNANRREEHGQDPNRDYPGPCISKTNSRLKSIQAIRSFLQTRIFAASLTVHGYLGALTYPWGVDVSNTHTNDHNQFESITAKAAAKNGYRYGTSTDIVYPCDGSFEDYAYWKHGIWSLLLELDSGVGQDIPETEEAIRTYFDLVSSTPSIWNELKGSCNSRSNRPDRRNE